MERGTFDDERKETVEKALSQTEAATKKVTALNTKIVNAGYATKNDLPSSYSRDERKLYQRIISIIDSYFASEPQTAEALREEIKSELSVKKNESTISRTKLQEQIPTNGIDENKHLS